MSIIEVKNLCKDYYQYKVFAKGKKLITALHNVSFKVKEGSFYGLLGVNGAGKTTLMKILTTNLKKTKGIVKINGVDIDKDEAKIKKIISWMFGIDYVGVSWSSVENNLQLACSFMGIPKRERQQKINGLINDFGLTNYRNLDVWRLSTGLRARYALAVAMIRNPKILFLDEPMLGLDVEAKDHLRKHLLRLQQEGTTIFFSSHLLQDMEKLCDYVLILNKGKVSYEGSLKHLQSKYKNINALNLHCSSKEINEIFHDLYGKLSFLKDFELIESYENNHLIKVFTSVPAEMVASELYQELRKREVVINQISTGILDLEDIFKRVIHKDDTLAEKMKYFHLTKEEPLEKHRKHLFDKNAKIRAHACLAFYKKDDVMVKKVLKEMLGKESMKAEAIDAIGKLRIAEFLPELRKLLESNDNIIKEHAIIALAFLGYEPAIFDFLYLMLHHETADFALDHAKELPEDVLMKLSKEIGKLNRSKKHFIHFHIEKRKDKEKLMHLLHIHKEEYPMRQVGLRFFHR